MRRFIRSSAPVDERRPLFGGEIKGVGPRYCPSIEDKIVKFPDRDRHQVFLEPEGLQSDVIYVNGLSTSMPIDVQRSMLGAMSGLHGSRIVRPGYAVEYDYVQPRELHPTLETKRVAGLFTPAKSTVLRGTRGCGAGLDGGNQCGPTAAGLSTVCAGTRRGLHQEY